MMGMCQPKGPQMSNGLPMQKMGCCPMMGQGKMSERGSGAESGIFGSRVTPVMNLSLDEVRDYLAVQLDHLNNKRLKVGDVDDKTITADIVTLDNSRVQRPGVNRRTGGIDYRN